MYPLKLVKNFGGDDDVPALLAKELNAVAPGHDKWGPNRVKRWLANEVVPYMEMRMVKEIGYHGEMCSWLDDIQKFLDSASA